MSEPLALLFLFAAIDLIDEAAAKIKMELTSRPTDLDETNREVLKLEMERLSLQKDEDKVSKERLSKLEKELEGLKEKQKELTDQWEKEKTLMNRITSVKEEVDCAYGFLFRFSVIRKTDVLYYVLNR